MCRRIAFFRGINVGGNNVLPMKELKTAMLELGLDNVQTVIQSGNVVFEAKSSTVNLKEDICKLISERFGFKPKLIIFSADELKRIFDATPYKSDEGKHLHYFMMQNSPSNPNFTLLEKNKVESEVYRLIDNVLYRHAPNGIARSKLVKTVEKAMGLVVTARNKNTLCRLLRII